MKHILQTVWHALLRFTATVRRGEQRRLADYVERRRRDLVRRTVERMDGT